MWGFLQQRTCRDCCNSAQKGICLAYDLKCCAVDICSPHCKQQHRQSTSAFAVHKHGVLLCACRAAFTDGYQNLKTSEQSVVLGGLADASRHADDAFMHAGHAMWTLRQGSNNIWNSRVSKEYLFHW